MKQEGIAGVGSSVEQNTAETLDIDMFLNSTIFEGGQRLHNRVILWLFQNIYNCRFFVSAKNIDIPAP
jgi:hypothetical protein